MTKTLHKWRSSECGYDDSSYCMHCGINCYQTSASSVGFTVPIESYCEDFPELKRKFDRVLGSTFYYVVRDNDYQYLDRNYNFNEFKLAKFYSRRSTASSALNNLTKYHGYDKDTLEVIELKITEPR